MSLNVYRPLPHLLHASFFTLRRPHLAFDGVVILRIFCALLFFLILRFGFLFSLLLPCSLSLLVTFEFLGLENLF